MKKQSDFITAINDVITSSGFVSSPPESAQETNEQTLSIATQTLLESSAKIQNIVRHIERHCAYADDVIIKESMRELNMVSGDLANLWQELDGSLMVLQN